MNVCIKGGQLVNNTLTSKPQRRLRSILGFGVLNFKDQNRRYIDIVFRNKDNKKISIEYNGQPFHFLSDIRKRTESLNKNGWYVLNINSGGKLVSKKYQVMGMINRMLETDTKGYTMFLDDWNFDENKVYRPFKKKVNNGG